MAEAFVEVLLQNLSSFIQKELGLFYGVNEELIKLSSLLSTIKAVLQDADQEQLKEKAIRNWLQKLNCATYEVDDVLDECAVKVIRLQEKSRRIGCISMPSGFTLENLLFRRQIGKKVKDAIRKLDGIAEERLKFHLSEVTSKKRLSTTDEVRETGFVLTSAEVYGRDNDKRKIVKILTKHVDDFQELLVLPIVGMGGLGKTTLAQLIYNDVLVHEHFDLKIWVCVSHNFDEKRLIRAILEAIVGKYINASELASLQSQLINLLRGKRYLLILDDVWNEDQEKWDKLKALLTIGSRGTSVITTTRLEKVASIMGTVQPHRLSCLSEYDCWLLFKQRAFGLDRKESSKLVDIGKEIVRRCCGVPLAAKALGSLLRFKNDEKEWLFVRDSDFWNLPQDESSILPALRLSYFHLPQDLRHCFAYCAIFEKGSKIDKEELIYFWMANGFISSEGNLEPEDKGNEIWSELYWRSLFQEVQQTSDGKMLFKIHDLVHDLAQSIMDDGIHATKLEGGKKISTSRIRHETIHAEDKSFLAFPKSTIPYNPSTIAMYGSLRVLIFCSVQLKELPSAIGDLIHLRYLDLFSTCIESLPQSICSLQNLQMLSVEDCCLLRVLPKHLNYLRNLRHLRLRGCPLSHMPPNIAQLTHLKTLNKFVVGKKRCSKLSELRDLNLQGELVIEHLERVENHMGVKEALNSKRNLHSLALYWNHSIRCESSKDVDLQVLEALEPHSDLKHLKVSGFRSTCLASWMRASVLRTIITLYLHDCKYCLHLSQLAQLPCLKYLSLRGIHVEYIDSNAESGVSQLRKFPSLESLEMCKLPNLKGVSIKEGKEQFPSLHEMWIENCPLLTFPHLVTLRNLRIMKCSNMTLASISNLCSLTCLEIANNKELTSFPEEVLTNLTDLEILTIMDFSKLEVLPNSLASLTALKSLDIGYCHQLESLPEQGLQGLTSVRKLSVRCSDRLKFLSEGFQYLASLEELEIFGCPELVSFPQEIKHLNSLHRVHLDGLPLFHSREDTVIHPEELGFWQLPEALRHVHNLQSLSVCRFSSLTLLPEWLGELTFLKELNIVQCDNLASLPECMERMNLQSLNILGCAILEKRCKPGQGEDWYKIEHIPKVKISQNCDFLSINLSSERFSGLRRFHL
ncbi:putative disease resistance protein RGA3 [Solanum verrucosum]|uniref:putative disease resistance protein RGA3 n=1 Tax=Solanum verrucosum TaxID=315347 RepID=UPI0020CFED24|nr:putative disease resistance protein RGA3 [Solanum verrucosum]